MVRLFWSALLLGILVIMGKIHCSTKCPEAFIHAYKNASYSNVMDSTARMVSQLQDYAVHDTALHPNRSECIKILNTRSGAITCAWPRYPGKGTKLNKDDIQKLEQRMEHYFKCRGLPFIRADGHYDGYHIPNSYIVLDINESEAIALAYSFAQYSVVLFNKKGAKLLHLWGKHKNLFYNAVSWNETPFAQDNFTVITLSNGLFKFNYDFDCSIRLFKYH